jgi:hypothetical protein
MAKASKATAAQVEQVPGMYEGRFSDLDGTTVAWERFEQTMDAAPLFVGLPDDRCQARHCGVVLAGRITFRYPEGDEVIEAGEAYVARPGHTPLMEAGTETLEFTPSDELAATLEVVNRNIAAGAPA